MSVTAFTTPGTGRKKMSDEAGGNGCQGYSQSLVLTLYRNVPDLKKRINTI